MSRSVFGFLSRRAEGPELVGEHHVLRLPANRDYDAWYRIRSASRAFLQPWEPAWGRDDLTEASFRSRVLRAGQENASGLAVPLLLFDRHSDELLGGIHIGNIRRGAAQSCMVGYWMGVMHAGKGHMRAALPLAIHHIFAGLSLHRIEAACIAHNQASIRLLEGAGFEREGLMRKYWNISGTWSDHVLYALINGDAGTDGTMQS